MTRTPSPMDIRTRRKMVSVLRVLREQDRPLGAESIAEELQKSGIDLSERTVRNYLSEADELGWTVNLGRRGRSLTELGQQEIEGALVVDKVGYVAARVDTLSYQMTFDPANQQGSIILNISTLALRDARAAIDIMTKVYDANLGMGRLGALGLPGELMGSLRVPEGRIAIGTICSVSINGIFLRANIATTSRFGGLLEMSGASPKRFTQVIHYDGTSLDPLEIFIRGYMTSVGQAVRTGTGLIGASFREVPGVALAEVRRLSALSHELGVGGVLLIGAPNQPLLDMPVPMGRTGIIVCGGLNPIAAVVEGGIPTTNAAMQTLYPYEKLIDYREMSRLIPRRRF